MAIKLISIWGQLNEKSKVKLKNERDEEQLNDKISG